MLKVHFQIAKSYNSNIRWFQISFVVKQNKSQQNEFRKDQNQNYKETKKCNKFSSFSNIEPKTTYK